MTKKEIHDLVQEYWVKCGKSFRPYYLHEDIDNNTDNSKHYERFMEFIKEIEIKK